MVFFPKPKPLSKAEQKSDRQSRAVETPSHFSNRLHIPGNICRISVNFKTIIGIKPILFSYQDR